MRAPGGETHGRLAGPSEPGGCEQAAGRRHMDRHIIKNRTGYLLLRGEREGEEEEEERDREGREGACVTKGEQ